MNMNRFSYLNKQFLNKQQIKRAQSPGRNKSPQRNNSPQRNDSPQRVNKNNVNSTNEIDEDFQKKIDELRIFANLNNSVLNSLLKLYR